MPWKISEKHYRTTAFRLMLLVVTFLVIFGSVYWSRHEDAYSKYMNISMKSSVAGAAQIFYDIGQGFTEKSVTTVTVQKGEYFIEYRFLLTGNEKIYNLRFDPLSSDGHVDIRQIQITDGLGNVYHKFKLEQLEPANQISRFDMLNDRVSVEIDTNANDPQIYIRLEKPLQLPPEVHPSYHRALFLNFCFILLTILLIYVWVNWKDPWNLKKWICYGLIVVGAGIVAFYCVQTCLGILSRSIQPFGGGDTVVFMHMAALKWTNPFFYHGLRPPVVPILHSLVNGADNHYNIILLQIIISCLSWLFLAFTVSYFLKDHMAKTFAFFVIALIPLNAFMHYWNLVILSESLSFSFLAVFLAAYLWYYNLRSIPSVIFLAVVALIFAFTRDTDAYRVLLMTPPILLLIAQQIRDKSRKVLRHTVLFIIFILIFIGSNYSTSNIHCRDCATPYMKARWFMPTINNLYQRILPFEDRVKFFADHGLPVTPELMAMKYQWASSNNWQSAFDPKLAAQGEWNYRHGRQTYMKFLITHPGYVFSSAYEYRDKLLYLDGAPNAWFHEMVKPLEAKILSVFFLNNDRDLKMLFVLFPVSLLAAFIVYIRNRRDYEAHIMTVLLVCNIILMTIPLGILIFHGDLMDLARHSFTNIIQLNLGVVLFYLFTADLLMMKLRKAAAK